jgi:putative ABC transport system permease protein
MNVTLRMWIQRMRGLFGKDQMDRELDEELKSHLEMHVADNVRRGMAGEEARRDALIRLGGVEQTKETVRDGYGLLWLKELMQESRYALRSLRKSPGFTFVAILTLALGIGASTAIFSVIENVLMDPFPYKDAGRLVFLNIHDTDAAESDGRNGFSSAEFLDFAEQNHVFDGVIAAAEEEVLYRQGDRTERLYGAHVTPGTFEFLGVPALYGRALQPADYQPGAPPVFVMRYKTWVTQFGGDPRIVNKQFTLNGMSRTLVGIMPPRFGWYEADVLIAEKPVHVAPEAGGEISAPWFLLGHLKPGITKAEADVDLTIIARRLSAVYPHLYPSKFNVQIRMLGDVVTGRIAATLYTVLAAVALLLLIGCGNVANLMLARALGRKKEMALRAVLGAGRSRLVRQLLVESLILALSGAALGTAFAWGGLKFLVAGLPQNVIPAEAVIQLNLPVLVFTLCVAALTALIFGLLPALQATRSDLIDPLRDSGKGVAGGGRHGRLRDAVVVLEVALSLTLLVGAGLLMRSFAALREEHLGFQPDHVLVARLPLPADRYKTAEQVSGFYRTLLDRLKGLPGVVDAAEANAVPPNGGMRSEIEILGMAHEEKWASLFQLCSEGYFNVLRFEFRNGRAFTTAEVGRARKLAVVNQTFARRYLGSQNPIGQQVRLIQLETFTDPVANAWFEIVGVVGDTKNAGLQSPIEPEVWVPYTVTASGTGGILLRSAQQPGSLVNEVRSEIWTMDPGLAVAYSQTLEDHINAYSYAGPRFGFLLMSIFGVVGLILVAIGVYSVLAYNTAHKTHEIGIRMALGAEGANVLGMVIRSGLRLVIAGVSIGLGVSLILGRLITAELWNVSSSDPLTLAGSVALLLLTGLLACWIPARRATRVEPMVALRYE